MKLEEHPDWIVIKEAWALAMPLAKSPMTSKWQIMRKKLVGETPVMSGKDSTTAEREVVLGKLDAAAEAARRLAKVGLLTEEEAELLVAWAEALREDIHESPPKDHQATCYVVDRLAPAKVSLRRLTDTLPILGRMVTSGKVQPVVIGNVLKRIDVDLVVLSTWAELIRLPKTERADAKQTRDAVKAEVGKLKALVGAP